MTARTIDDSGVVGRAVARRRRSRSSDDGAPDGGASTCGAPRSRRAIPTARVTASSTADFSPATTATLDADGGWRCVGRVSSFVNVAGRKVQPEEVERVLREMPGVARRRVSGRARRRARPADRRLHRRRTRRERSASLAVRRFCSARARAVQDPADDRFLDAHSDRRRAAKSIEPRSTSWCSRSTYARSAMI